MPTIRSPDLPFTLSYPAVYLRAWLIETLPSDFQLGSAKGKPQPELRGRQEREAGTFTPSAPHQPSPQGLSRAACLPQPRLLVPLVGGLCPVASPMLPPRDPTPFPSHAPSLSSPSVLGRKQKRLLLASRHCTWGLWFENDTFIKL